jgi:hypothetical protein
MGRKRMAALLGSITYCVVLLAGCTSNSGVVTQTPDTSTSTSVKSSPTSITRSPVQSVSASPSSASTALSSAVGNPWPADFTPDQVAVAQAALTAVDGYIKVTAAANADPAAKDWTSDIRKYAADPAATQTLEAISSLISAQVHQTVPPTYEQPTVTEADDHKVVVETCLDNTATAAVDADGASVLDPSPTPRSILTLTLYRYAPEDGGWLVSEKATSTPARTC